MGKFPAPPKTQTRSWGPLLQEHLPVRRRILRESSQDSRQGLGVGAGAWSLVGAAVYPLPLPTSSTPCSSALPLVFLLWTQISWSPGTQVNPKAPTLGRTGRWRGPRSQLGLPVGLVGENQAEVRTQ